MTFTLMSVFRRYPLRITATLLLVLAESLLDVLYPLVIGWAVNGLLNANYDGLIYLGMLGITTLVIGSARRFYDTRVYSGIYADIASQMVTRGRQDTLSVSKLSARSSLLTELVEFFEQSVPGIVLSLVGVFGTLIVIATLNVYIVYACVGLLALMTLVYWLTGKTQYFYHQQYNGTLEQRVDVLSGRSSAAVRGHFLKLMRWNIKLSDMETLNFGVIWLGIIALLIATPVLAINTSQQTPEVGTLLSLLIYVFDYSEKVVMLPFFIQQLIRLKEISVRLNSTSLPSADTVPVTEPLTHRSN